MSRDYTVSRRSKKARRLGIVRIDVISQQEVIRELKKKINIPSNCNNDIGNFENFPGLEKVSRELDSSTSINI